MLRLVELLAVWHSYNKLGPERFFRRVLVGIVVGFLIGLALLAFILANANTD
jgi:uncharacterized membrane protein YraQ (UPF0718 family)